MTPKSDTYQVVAVLRLETHYCTNGRLKSRGSFPGFLRALAQEGRRVLAILPVVDVPGVSVDADDVVAEVSQLHGLLPLPRCEGYARAFLAVPSLLLALVKARRETRILIARVPEHLNLVALPLASMLGFHIFCWLVADRDAILSAELQRRGLTLSGMAGWLLNKLTGAMEVRYVRRCPVIANGRALSEKALHRRRTAGEVLEVQSTTLPANLPSARPRSKAPVLNVLYVGRFAPEKGVADLLAATQLLKQRMPFAGFYEIRTRLVGWSAHGEDARLRDDVHRLGVADCVEVVGALPFGDRLFDQYQQADVFVIPSWIEGTPRVLVEAMAFGLPVVATRVGGIPELVTDGVNGLLISPRSPGEIAAAIYRIAADEAMRAELGARARTHAKGQTAEALASRMAQFIAAMTASPDD